MEEVCTDNDVVTTYSYQYDNNGNLYSKIRSVVSPDGDGEESLEIAIIGEDADPELGAIYEYDALNRLKTIYQGENTIINTYNGDGLRASKAVNGAVQYYLYENGKIVLEEAGNGTETARNVYGIYLLSRETADGDYTYRFNGHGDVIALTDSTGTVVASYYYDPFGVITEETGEVTNPFRYVGEYYDQETGMVYLRARYYDPSIGRFISEDPIRDGYNWYVYCSNNPIMYIDPLGLFDYDTKLSYSQEYDEDVEALQQRLVLIGYMQEPPAGEWGYFGVKTQAAVNKYKEDNNLWNFKQYKGVVGLTTWQHLGLEYRTQEDIDAGITIAMTSEREQYKDITLVLESALANVTQEAQIYKGTIYRSIWFINKVTHGAPWDIKRKEPWENLIGGGTYPGLRTPVYYSGLIITPEELGNYTYGYIGNALDYSLEDLYKASWIAAGAPTKYDELKNEYGDWVFIQMGFKDYD